MGDGYEDAWVFGYRPPVYRVPFDEAEHWSVGIPARTYPSGSRSGPTSKYPRTGFTHPHPDQSSGFRDVPRNRRENCGQGCPRTRVEPTVAESRTCEGWLPGRTCARVVGAKNCPDQREKAGVRGTLVRRASLPARTRLVPAPVLRRSIPRQASPMRTQTKVQASGTCHGTDKKTAGKDASGPVRNPP